jgi:four helix bundle protein
VPFLVDNLRTYNKALDFADRITALTESFPRGKYYLADQLNRAVVSIAANIAEGNGRYGGRDRRQFFVIARASAHECIPLLELAVRRGLIGDETHNELGRHLDVISKMLFALIDKR